MTDKKTIFIKVGISFSDKNTYLSNVCGLEDYLYKPCGINSMSKEAYYLLLFLNGKYSWEEFKRLSTNYLKSKISEDELKTYLNVVNKLDNITLTFDTPKKYMFSKESAANKSYLKKIDKFLISNESFVINNTNLKIEHFRKPLTGAIKNNFNIKFLISDIISFTDFVKANIYNFVQTGKFFPLSIYAKQIKLYNELFKEYNLSESKSTFLTNKVLSKYRESIDKYYLDKKRQDNFLLVRSPTSAFVPYIKKN